VSFCAVCTSEREPLVLRPLGRDDALVNVCASCDEEPADVRHGPERSYEPSGGLPSLAESTAGIRKALGADYDRLTRIENAITLAPSAENRHAGEGDFATLRYDHEQAKRVRARRGRP